MAGVCQAHAPTAPWSGMPARGTWAVHGARASAGSAVGSPFSSRTCGPFDARHGTNVRLSPSPPESPRALGFRGARRGAIVPHLVDSIGFSCPSKDPLRQFLSLCPRREAVPAQWRGSRKRPATDGRAVQVDGGSEVLGRLQGRSARHWTCRCSDCRHARRNGRQRLPRQQLARLALGNESCDRLCPMSHGHGAGRTG